ncbi:MAG: hypothetical protein J2P21_01170 [Chloracidobacterium sp.]|nr:hypothetical protein [Chloracidobacterium sp.]
MNANEAILKRPWTLRFRLLGLLPLCFFIARAIEYIVLAKTPEQMLWSCHISNLMLAVGLFIGSPFLIRVAVFWLILGVPAWVYATTVNMAWFKPEMLVSIFSHLGGATVSIIAIHRIGAKLGSWIPSLIYFVILQQITRLLTNATPYTNVNVSHFAYGPMKDWFASYWTYLVVNTTAVAILLIILEFVLLRLYHKGGMGDDSATIIR